MNSANAKIKAYIRSVPNFPRKGILFKDITPLLKNPDIFQKVVKILASRYKLKNLNAVVAIESRGFIFGSVIAYILNIPFIPLRKPGKLPWKTRKVSYKLEYGKSALEIHSDALHKGARVIIVDDLLATGGTVLAATKLINQLGAKVVETVFVVELSALKGRDKIKSPVYSLLQY